MTGRRAAGATGGTPEPSDIRKGLPAPGDLLRTARPRQWTKNLLVFAAPATGHVLGDADAVFHALLAFVTFTLAASGLYFLNDLADRQGDRSHPTKRSRPIAAGTVSPVAAVSAATVLLTAALVIGVAGVSLAFTGILLLYIALTLSYTLALRQMVVIDLAAIAGGFLLRAVAGGVAVDVPLSSWFLIVASFGSLFVAAGKRHAEYLLLGTEAHTHRSTLADYSDQYLRFVQYSSATVAITAYCLWAFEAESVQAQWAGLSIVPFVLGVLRYALLAEGGRGGTPEELVLRDPPLFVVGVAWVVLVTVGVYTR